MDFTTTHNFYEEEKKQGEEPCSSNTLTAVNGLKGGQAEVGVTISPSTATFGPQITSVERVSLRVRKHRPGPASRTRSPAAQSPTPVPVAGPSGSCKRKAMDPASGSDTEILDSDDMDKDSSGEEFGRMHSRSSSVSGESRGRGRPATTGHYVGLSKARYKAAKLKEVRLAQEVEQELIEQERARRESRMVFTQKVAEGISACNHDPQQIDEAKKSVLLREVSDAVATVRKVAKSSSRLKSTYVKFLNLAAENISSASEKLSALTTSGEIIRLERENASLRAENTALKDMMSCLQNDMADIKKELQGKADKPTSPPPNLVTPSPSPSPPKVDEGEPIPHRYETRSKKGNHPSRGNCPPPFLSAQSLPPLPDDGFGEDMEVTEEADSLPKTDTIPPKNTPPEAAQHPALQGIMGEVLRQIGDMMNARFATIESRLLPEEKFRPPLQGDKRKLVGPITPSQHGVDKKDTPSTPLSSTSGNSPNKTEWISVKGKGKKGKKGKGTPAPPPTSLSPIKEDGRTPLGSANKQATSKTSKSYAEAARTERKKETSSAFKGPSHGKEPSLRKPGKPSSGSKASESNPGQPKGKSPPVKTRKPPRRTAAVTLSLLPAPEGQQQEGKNPSLAEILKVAKENINLKEIGIEYLRPKRAITGALILEVPGENSSPKADNLAAKLTQVVGDLGVKVARPIKCAELRVTRLDDSATSESIAIAIAELGGCSPANVKVAPPKRAAQGLFAAWVRCPESAAYKAAKSGKVQVGWAQAKVELLKARPLQCFRCLEFGHTRQRCTAATDRGDICYRCSQSGHMAGGCPNAPHCTLCAEKGLKAAHRMGGNACPMAAPTSKKKGKATTATRTTRDKISRTTREETSRDKSTRTARDPSKTKPTPAPTTEKGKERGRTVQPTAQFSPPNNKGDAKSPPSKEVSLEEAMDTAQ